MYTSDPFDAIPSDQKWSQSRFFNIQDGLMFVHKSDLGLCYVVSSVLNGTYA